jgi:6-phosphofructo-2-kinase/fructose-2,6-biphosphatase 2
MNNIQEVKLYSPDYTDVDEKYAIEDYKNRILHYEKRYETLDASEIDKQICFVKLLNVGTQILVNNIRGYLQSRIVYFLMNLNLTPKSFYISRHGESLFNINQIIGGNSSLSPRGVEFSRLIPVEMIREVGKGNLTVWTSTLKRTIETAAYLPFKKLEWKQLDELDSGSCDGLTYGEIEKRYPEDFEARDKDKFNYRYHGGESYRDLVHRLEPVILELERHDDQDQLIYIIGFSIFLRKGHQAVVRAIYAYFHNICHEDLPYIKIALHTIIKLSPKAYGCQEEHIKIDVPCVDTFRFFSFNFEV